MEKVSVVSKEEAAEMVNSGDRIVWNSFGSLGFPEELCRTIGDRFLETGEPNDLSYIFATAGVWDENRMIELMAYEGMIKKVVTSHFTPLPKIQQQARDNEIEGYDLPLGVLEHLFRAAAGKKPGILTKVGLNCFIDPRNRGAGVNDVSQEEMVELMLLDGEEYLFYKAPEPNLALLKGTTADVNGNISMEKEAVYLDPFATAMAAKANGGKVIVQVERLSSEKAQPRDVKIPGTIVDAVVVAPDQKQTMIEDYNPAFTGEIRIPEEQVAEERERINELNRKEAGLEKERTFAHRVIARRAAKELSQDDVVNIGVGLPEMIPDAASEIGVDKDITLTVESGAIGGYPSTGINFGASINLEMLQDEAYQFDYYDGGGLDITFLGTLEVDQAGNVNVSRIGDNLIGIGGFINLTQSAREVVYCFPFSSKGLEVEYTNDELKILKEGKYKKFSRRVDEISSSGEFSAKIGQKVLYITERCVFELTGEGLKIVEIAPGLSVEEDVVSKMPFEPLVSSDVKTMDEDLFLK